MTRSRGEMGRCLTPAVKRGSAGSLSRNVRVMLWQSAWRHAAPWRMQTAGPQLCAPCWVSGCVQGQAVACCDVPREGWKATALRCGVGGKGTVVPVAAGKGLS